jgi:membrane protein YqaA with SNARE-associated domain
MLIPMVLANRSQWWRLALTATIASVMGGLAGYAIGLFLYETIGNVVIGFYAYGDKFLEYMDIYEEWGGWAVFGAGLTPFPYKVITIASGVVKLDLSVFILMSSIARGIRFFSVAGLLYYFGESAKLLIEKYFGLLTVLFFIILVAGFFIISFAF